MPTEELFVVTVIWREGPKDQTIMGDRHTLYVVACDYADVQRKVSAHFQKMHKRHLAKNPTWLFEELAIENISHIQEQLLA